MRHLLEVKHVPFLKNSMYPRHLFPYEPLSFYVLGLCKKPVHHLHDRTYPMSQKVGVAMHYCPATLAFLAIAYNKFSMMVLLKYY